MAPERIERPPGPRNWPGLGASLDFQSDSLAAMLRYARTYGDLTYFRVPGAEIYIATHPDDIASVVVGQHAKYMKDHLLHDVDRFVGRGLLTSEGAFWRRQRKTVAPVFQRRHIERFGDVMVRRAAERAELMAADGAGARDVHADMMIVTLQIVLDTMFGSYELPDLDEVGAMVDAMLGEFQRTMMTWRRIIPRAANPEPYARMDAAVQRMDDVLYGLIARRREDGAEADDLLGRLLAARDDEGQGMSDRQIRDEVATVFLAGHETTALALSYALLQLSRFPAVAERLVAEVDEVLDGRDATVADVARLPYTDAVVRETMRLYPPAYTIGREALETCQLRGYEIPRGAQVLTPMWVVHRDPRWWDEPERFAPERWLDGLATRLHRFAYFPFGGGPRICVGNHFAMQEGILVLATLVQHLEVRPQPGFELKLSPSVTLRPTAGVHLQVAPRVRPSVRDAGYRRPGA